MKRFFPHGTSLQRKNRLALFQCPLESFGKRGFPRPHRPHQVKNLPGLFPFHGGRVKIAHNLHDGSCNAKKIVPEEVVYSDNVVAINPAQPGVFFRPYHLHPLLGYEIVHPFMSKHGNLRVFLDNLQVVQQGSLEVFVLPFLAIPVDQALKIYTIHWHSPPSPPPALPALRTASPISR